MKPQVTYPDPERTVADWLRPLIEDEADVGIGVPSEQTTTSSAYLQVAVDGQVPLHPIASRALIRFTAWAPSTSEAKRICALAQGLLLGQQEWPTDPVSGPIPARDPDTQVELAFARTNVVLRSVPIT